MPPPRFDPDAEVWVGLCPWCANDESHQVGSETDARAVVWCRTCSGSSLLVRGSSELLPRTPPKPLHDKRRDNGKRLPKQHAPLAPPGGGVPDEYRRPTF
jgi:hypothetical protein